MELIDVAPFRIEMERAIARGGSACAMARKIGFVKTREVAESTRLLKLAGVKPSRSKYTGQLQNKQQISVEKAYIICEALDLDPVEMGL